MSPLGLLNFIVLQWFGVRLARTYAHKLMCGYVVDATLMRNGAVSVGSTWHRGERVPVGWKLLRWIVPLTGWWSPFVYLKRWTPGRVLQLVTNVHRIHHIQWAYGYTFRPIPWAYFPPFKVRDSDVPGGYRRLYYGWRRVKPSGFHDCTWTGRG